MQVIVLNDGETFTNLQGCSVFDVPDDADTEIIEQIIENDEPIFFFNTDSITEVIDAGKS